MSGRRVYLAVVMILLIAALVMPESRRVLGLQLGYVARIQAYPNLLLKPVSKPPLPFFKSQASVLSDWERYIALAELHSDDAEGYCEKAIRAAPERPEPYAAAIRFYSQRTRYTRREESELTGRDSQPQRGSEDPNPKFSNKMLALAGQGSKLDPDNAFFNLMAAYSLYGMRRDTEALDMMRSAARKSRYNSYSRMSGIAMKEYLEAAGLPGVEAYLTWYSLTFPHLACIRSVSLMTVWHARQLEAEGHSKKTEELLVSLVKISSLMRKDSTIAMEHLTADSVQAMIGLIEPKKDKPGKTGAYNSIGWEQEKLNRDRRILTILRTHGWLDLAALWEKESKASLEFRHRLNDYNRNSRFHLHMLVLILGSAEIGYLIVRLIIMLFIIGMLAWLMLRLSRRSEPAREPGMPWKIWLAVLAILPWLVITGISIYPMVRNGGGW